jgi:hypothetical protein
LSEASVIVVGENASPLPIRMLIGIVSPVTIPGVGLVSPVRTKSVRSQTSIYPPVFRTLKVTPRLALLGTDCW